MTAHALTTNRRAFAQVVFCTGCCCGRVDRGRPEVPVERLKRLWRAEKLNAAVQLTISGCLGPCDLANVALVILPAGMSWYGNMDGDAFYDAFIDWARRCRASGGVVPLPASLDAHRFERFSPALDSRGKEQSVVQPVWHAAEACLGSVGASQGLGARVV